MNHQNTSFKKVRSQIAVVILPFQTIVDRPVQFYRWVENSFSSQQDILEENARLRARQIMLQAKLQRLLSLEKENAQLRELLSSSSQLSDKMIVAQLLSADLDPLTQEVVVDKGTRDGVFIGQPVLDAYGIMGQVIDVGLFTSKILLITDARSAIPVQDTRNGLRAIISGTSYSNELILLHTPTTVDVKVGDYFVTSGLGGRFPFGYPVGQVAAIKKATTERFASIIIKPAAHVDRARLVVLVWPPETPNAQESAENWREAIKVQEVPH